MCDHTNSILDWSWPGSTMAVTRDCYPRVTGGHATWMQRRRRGGRQWRQKREKPEERKQAKRVNLKVGTLNVGTMTGKGRKIADVMERRDVDVLCMQETRCRVQRLDASVEAANCGILEMTTLGMLWVSY